MSMRGELPRGFALQELNDLSRYLDKVWAGHSGLSRDADGLKAKGGFFRHDILQGEVMGGMRVLAATAFRHGKELVLRFTIAEGEADFRIPADVSAQLLAAILSSLPDRRSLPDKEQNELLLSPIEGLSVLHQTTGSDLILGIEVCGHVLPVQIPLRAAQEFAETILPPKGRLN